MDIWHSFAEARQALCSRTAAVAIGTFDGVHLGHQAIIAALRRGAEERLLHSLVITFDRHPGAVVGLGAPPLLTPVETRLRLLAGLGVQAALLLSFDEEFAALAPAEFVRGKLLNELGARLIAIGHDFRFGARGAGNAALLRSIGSPCGLEVVEVPPVLVDGIAVSSTAIRWALAAGDVAAANRYLGRPYAVRGAVETGRRRGRKLGFPTANLRLADDALWPRYGVYAVRIRLADGFSPPQVYDGVANVGIKPTFGRSEPTVEAYLFGYCGDLYGRIIDVEFMGFVRPERKFRSADELQAQIAEDAAKARRMLKRET